MKKTWILILLGLSISIVACKKDNDDDNSCVTCSNHPSISQVCIGDEIDPVNKDAGQYTQEELQRFLGNAISSGYDCRFK